MTDRERELIEWSRRESPAQESRFFWEVAFPVFAAAAGTYLVVAAAFGDMPGRGAAGAIMLIMLAYRLVMWDRYGHGKHIVERQVRLQDPQQPRREWAPVMVTNGDDGNGHTWTIGHWSFSDREWYRMWRHVLQPGSLARDNLAPVMLDNGERMFPSYTRRYREYEAEFRRLGWIDDDGNVTDAARTWFEERNLTTSPTARP